MTIADYCDAMKRGDIIVNSEYQRSDEVWPPAARSFLIESILLGYPLPKISLFQITDIKSKKTYKEIVDGQQRSKAIREFFAGEMRLSRGLESEDIAGCVYDELPDDYRSRFLSFALSSDLFVNTTPEQVREMFRRMNSYTVPLNPEENRHAIWQGKFKWFIYKLARELGVPLNDMGVFTQKQLVRMGDMKLLAEVCHALAYGIETTDKEKLDKLYEERDGEFTEEREWGARIRRAWETIQQWDALRGGPLLKPYSTYSLLLAVTHCQKAVAALEGASKGIRAELLPMNEAAHNLTLLAAAVEQEDVKGRYGGFVKACDEKTNVKEQRVERFRWFLKAVGSERF